jgi:hypothetical protein
MALNFPSNPTIGSTYTQDSNTWTYDGYRWTLNVTQTLDGLSDIVTTPVIENGSSLLYNSTIQKWEPKVDTTSIAYAIALS